MMDEFHHRPGKGGLNSRVNRRLRDIYDRAGVLLITQLQKIIYYKPVGPSVEP